VEYTRLGTKTIQRHWQHWVHRTQDEDNPETLAAWGYTRHGTKTIQRHWQHGVYKTRDEDNLETLAALVTQDTGRRQSRDTGSIGYTRHRTKTI
jgi:hypothetical protein